MALRRWFAAAARDLPWRGPFPRDPYRVLVAEVMLQQTQVSRVVDAFQRFLTCFPTLEALAAATQDEVVAQFGGLGYYRRARMLHAAAQAVHAAGTWPREPEALRHLPGMGPYTTAALMAFAFDGQEPPVDGNVMRVASRLLACEHPAGSRALMQQAGMVAQGLVGSPAQPVTWEALMELGATLCTPTHPRCLVCPLNDICAASREGTQERFPVVRTRRRAEHHTWATAWVERTDGTILLRHRHRDTVLRGLWLPPIAELGDGENASAEHVMALLPFPANHLAPMRLEEFRHAITYRRIRVIPYRLDLDTVHPDQLPPGWRWEHPSAVLGRSSSLLTKLHRAIVSGGLS